MLRPPLHPLPQLFSSSLFSLSSSFSSSPTLDRRHLLLAFRILHRLPHHRLSSFFPFSLSSSFSSPQLLPLLRHHQPALLPRLPATVLPLCLLHHLLQQPPLILTCPS